MKSTFQVASILLALSVCLVNFACNKDDSDDGVNFENITRADIVLKEATLSNENIVATDASGHILDAGIVLIYKTSENKYGKFEILSIDDEDNYKLTLKAVTYDDDGSILSQTESLVIRGTYLGDLDTMAEMIDGDFQWHRSTSTDTYLEPVNGAVFAVY